MESRSTSFEHVVFLNMSPDNLARYDRYYQFHDPIEPSLQKRRRATLVCEVMPQKGLEKTEILGIYVSGELSVDLILGNVRLLFWMQFSRIFATLCAMSGP